MRPCPGCGKRTNEGVCPSCGTQVIVSVGSDSLDSMIEQASTPNLADLMRKAKARGVLDTAGPEYGG